MTAPKHRKDVPVDACCWGGHAPCKACASAQAAGTHSAEVALRVVRPGGES